MYQPSAINTYQYCLCVFRTMLQWVSIHSETEYRFWALIKTVGAAVTKIATPLISHTLKWSRQWHEMWRYRSMPPTVLSLWVLCNFLLPIQLFTLLDKQAFCTICSYCVNNNAIMSMYTAHAFPMKSVLRVLYILAFWDFMPWSCHYRRILYISQGIGVSHAHWTSSCLLIHTIKLFNSHATMEPCNLSIDRTPASRLRFGDPSW